MLRTIITPYKYKLIKKLIDKKTAINILDVGCAHNSFNICKRKRERHKITVIFN